MSSKDEIYVQCRFEQHHGDEVYHTMGWIPERGAKLGAKVELKGEEGLWVVVSAGGPSIPISRLREKQMADRAQREASDI